MTAPTANLGAVAAMIAAEVRRLLDAEVWRLLAAEVWRLLAAEVWRLLAAEVRRLLAGVATSWFSRVIEAAMDIYTGTTNQYSKKDREIRELVCSVSV